MSKGPILFNAGISGVRTLADKTLSITMHTQEMPSEVKVRIMDLQHIPCAIFMSEYEVTDESVEMVEGLTKAPKVKGRKSQSERLRNVLYRYHEQEMMDISFEDYYHSEMERIITHYKNKLQ